MDSLILKFKTEAERALKDFPELNHRWIDGPKTIKLELPKKNQDGFDIAIEAGDGALSIQTDCGWHDQFCGTELTDRSVNNILGLTRDLLTSRMRIRELIAGKTAYRWLLEAFDGSVWRIEGSMGLLFWNYFGQRSEHIYQNDSLPVRPLGH